MRFISSVQQRDPGQLAMDALNKIVSLWETAVMDPIEQIHETASAERAAKSPSFSALRELLERMTGDVFSEKQEWINHFISLQASLAVIEYLYGEAHLQFDAMTSKLMTCIKQLEGVSVEGQKKLLLEIKILQSKSDMFYQHMQNFKMKKNKCNQAIEEECQLLKVFLQETQQKRLQEVLTLSFKSLTQLHFLPKKRNT